jgi:hypothetical protein
MIFDTTRDSAEPVQDGAPEPVSARVLREVLRTPPFREIVRLHCNELRRGEGRALVRTLLREDPALWLSAVSITPRLVDTVTESLVELGRELTAMPPALVDAYLEEVVREIDRETLRDLPVVWAPILARALPGVVNVVFDTLAGAAAALGSLEPAAREAALERLGQGVETERAAAAVNALAAMVIGLGRDHPTLLESPPGPDWAALVRSIDHGKLRVAVIVASGFVRRSAQPLVARWLTDPVASANLLLALPELVNDGVRLLSFVVDQMDLPDELFASATFNVLRELDLAALGGLVSRVARTFNVLHQGSTTIGLEEPAFKEVFVELVDGLLESVDQPGVADAVVALAEDGDVMARVLARRFTTDPALLSVTLDTTVRLLNVALATGREVLTEIEQLPDAALEQLGARLDEVDPRAMGEVLSQLLRGVIRGERLLGRQGWLEEVLAAVDWEEAGELLWRLATPMAHAYVAAGWRRYRDRPEDLGSWINHQLEQFNRTVAANPEWVSAFVPRALSAVDTRELTRALGTAWRLLGGAVYATAQARPLWQIFFSPPWRRGRPEAEGAR